MTFLKPFLVFLIINFAALGIGSKLMGNGAKSEWYQSLNKAPWTPDGWVFGAAWTILMICFAAYMAFLYNSPVARSSFFILFGLQLLFNISWNYFFFNQQNTQVALLVIVVLLTIVLILFVKYYFNLGFKSALILPYLIWLLIATSLNLFIVLKN